MARVANLSRGNYVLGGLGARTGPSVGEKMNEALAADLGMRAAGLDMQRVRQDMDLAMRQEARTQATFEAQQAAAARARAAQAQLDADNRALIEAMRGAMQPGALAPTGDAPRRPPMAVSPEDLPSAIGDATGGRAGLTLGEFGTLPGTLSDFVAPGATGPRIAGAPEETLTVGETGPGEQTPVLPEPITVELYGGDGQPYTIDVYGNVYLGDTLVSEDPGNDPLTRAIYARAGLDPDEMLAIVSGVPAVPATPAVLGPVAPNADVRAGLSGFRSGLRPSAATTAPFVTPDILDAIGVTPEDFARLSLEEQNEILAFQDPTRPGEEPDTSGLGAITSRALQAQRELEDVNRRLETAMASLGQPGADNNTLSRFITELSAQRDALEQIVAAGEGVITDLTTTRGRGVLAAEGPEATGIFPTPAPTEAEAETPRGPVRTEAGGLRLDPNRERSDDPLTESVIDATEALRPTREELTDGTDAVGSMVAATVGAPPDFMLQNPALAYQLSEQLAVERRLLEAQLEYAAARNDPQAYLAIAQQLNSEERIISEYMANGQVALAEAQAGDFGALQAFYQSAYPNSDLQVYPYEDGTIAIYRDGVEQGRYEYGDLLERLASQFNTEYRDALAAQAAQAQERAAYVFEQEVAQLALLNREMTLAQFEAALEDAADNTNTEVTVDVLAGTDPPVMTYTIGDGPPRFFALTPSTTTSPSGEPVYTVSPEEFMIPGFAP